MRLFVAIELDPGVKKALSETAGLLIKQVCRANLTRLENLHITLAFIGETDRVDEIKKSLTGFRENLLILRLTGLAVLEIYFM